MVINTTEPDDHYTKLKQQYCDLFRKFRNESAIVQDSLLIFTRIINSPRTSSRINTLEQLLAVLEYRDELSEDNVTILKEWAVAMKWFTIQPLLEQYEKLQGVYSKDPRCDVCDIPIQRNLELRDPKPVNPDKPSNKETEISKNDADLDDAFDLISPHLGRAWKDLARKCKLTEYEIQDVEKEPRLVDCAYRVFTCWKEKAGTEATVLTLVGLLEKCRRKDLVDKLTKLKLY